MAQEIVKCGCKVTTNIADQIEWGTGKLDFNGFWEIPCPHGNKPIDVEEYKRREERNG